MSGSEPLAIVGAGCRLPGGVASLADLRELLRGSASGVVEVPDDRWDAQALYHPDFRKRGHIHSTRGGFLQDVAGFDAGFFGIAPREAARMDPQQRLTLEVCYRALEDAGLTLDELAGSNTAVYMGCGNRDYDGVQSRETIGPTSNTGSALSIVANRVSFLFDLRGPSVSVATACSSSLTALHLACQAVWDGSADQALAGAVSLILRPEPSIGFSTGGYLSPDGECRAFSDHANGYVRGEGAAAVLIMPLEAARRSGRRVHGLIRATVLNQDGRTPGMTMPSQAAQERMLAAAYRRAGVRPEEVVYVEAHGTGTPVGDPIEAGAIGRVLGGTSRPAPLYLGSVKTNVGHLEPAAGMAGLLKLLLTLRHREVYPNRCFRAPNPEIDFAGLHLVVPTAVIPLPAEGPLVGGLNSFGFGGTNGHLVLESPPSQLPAPSREASPGPHLVLLSASGDAALAASAGDLADHLERDATPLDETCAALVGQRSAFTHRLALVADDRGAAVDTLRRHARGEPAPGLRLARVPDGAPRRPVVFVFGGQGPQWWAMGRELLQAHPVFRARVLQVESDLRDLGWLREAQSTLTRELTRDEASSRMSETQIAQPALFALQLGLADVLRAHGLAPAAVVGHSIGELAAAVVAGALTAEEATRVVFWRSRCQALAEGQGSMAALGVSAQEADELLASRAGRVEVAAVNGPAAVTVAGARDAVQELVAELEAQGRYVRVLDVSVPFHCFLMDPVEEPFRVGLGRVACHAAAVPFHSTVTAARTDGAALGAGYWWENIRRPVRFAGAIEGLLDVGLTHFVELGPQPILSRGVRALLDARGAQGVVIPTLIRGEPELPALLRCVADAYLHNVPCRPIAHEVPGRVLPLPPYPFQRQPHWSETPSARLARRSGRPHPVVDRPRASSESRCFQAGLTVDPEAEVWLRDHHVQGLIVFPGAGQLEAACSAASLAWSGAEPWLESVEFLLPMSLPPRGDPPSFQLDVYSDEGHFQVASQSAPGDAWSVHTRGRLNVVDPFPRQRVDLAAVRARVTQPVDPERFYREVAATGLELGPAFQGIRSLWVDPARGEVVSRVEPPAELDADLGRFRVHPALFDSVIQAASLGSVSLGLKGLFLPQRVRRVEIRRRPRGQLWCVSRLVRGLPDAVEMDVWALDDEGQTVIELQGFVMRRVGGTSQGARQGVDYEFCWEPAPESRPRELTGSRWLVLGRADEPSVAAAIRALESRGARVTARDPEDEPESTACDPRTLDGLLHVGSWDPRNQDPEACLRAGPAALTRWLVALDTAQAWRPERAGVFIATPGGPAGPSPWGAPLWGAGRVIRLEARSLPLTCVEVEWPLTPETLEALLDLLADPHPPTEVALRGGERWIHRLRPADPSRLKRVPLPARRYQAELGTPGLLDTARFVERAPRAPGPGQIEVEVRACALNFKDVVVGLNLLDDAAWEGGMSGAELGMDCAGIVSAVGPGVEAFRVGDRVVGMAPGSLASHVLAEPAHMVHLPPEMSFSAGAALPAVFLTAEVGLVRLARLQAGETVLIHAAAGGVGSAAVQIAHERGARVLGTTSSQAKRDYLAQLGVATVFHSRSATFRQPLLEATDGRGVDVVLNSLSGDAMTQGIRCLAPFGRFVEIGKLDLYRNRQVGLQPFAENLSYHCLDLNRWLKAFLGEAKPMLEVIVAKAAAGTYRMPVESFPASELRDALRFLAQGKHVGKVVLELPREGELEVVPGSRQLVRPDGCYVITGGCAGFGLEIAEWLARMGAGALLLLNRGGAPAESAARLEAIRRRGTRVSTPPCDVGDPEALARALSQARDTAGPLRGVFHAAMVLDDAPYPALTEARYLAVGHPKLRGAWNLHLATADDPLEHFVLLSSVAAVLGTPGQANYAAANAFLDALASYRRAQGLPACALAYGVLDGAGVVARADEARRAKILGQGVAAFDVPRALTLLEQVLLQEPSYRLAADIDWERLTALDPADREGCFGGLVRGEAPSGGDHSLLDALRSLEPSERGPQLVAWFREFVAQVSGQDVAQIDAGSSLTRLGIDSLMANQLLTWLESSFRVEIPLVRLMQGPTLQELADDVCAALPEPAARNEAV